MRISTRLVRVSLKAVFCSIAGQRQLSVVASMKAKKWVTTKLFEGEPKESDLEIVEEELKPLQQNEILFEALYISPDPYVRIVMNNFPVGSTVLGQQVGKVVESKNSKYPVGSLISGMFGWRTHTVINPDNIPTNWPVSGLETIPENMGDLPLSLVLGTFGMTGLTAYFGLIKLLEPGPGKVLLVNAASGAVGSAVGQIGKIKGCRTIGCAGSEAKCAWLKELGFDYVFNYKTVDLGTVLKEAAPDGIDCYFDNVGGKFTDEVLANHMKEFGRVAVCGSISGYNATEAPQIPSPWVTVIMKQLTISGFVFNRWTKEYDVAKKELVEWVKQGKLKYREDVTVGFENARKSFYDMLKGKNNGKAVVKV